MSNIAKSESDKKPYLRIRKPYQDKRTLQLLYQKYTLREIAEMYGISFQLVHQYIQKFNISKVSRKEPARTVRLSSEHCQKLIKGIKETKGLNNYDIASLINLSANEIYRIEKGLSTPQLATGKKLLKLYRRLNKD